MCKSAIRLALVLALLAIPAGVAYADEHGGDTTPPTLYLPGDFSQEAWSPDGAWVWWWADAWDEVDGWVGVQCVPSSGSLFPVGATTVECSATDSSGNTATGSFTVTVLRDETPPTLHLPDPMTVQAWETTGAYVWYDAYAIDDRDGWIYANCSPLAGSWFPIGTTTVECSATDFSGNTATGSFTVSVVTPTTPPTLYLPEPMTVDASGAGGTSVWYYAYGIDARGWWLTADCAPASGSLFPVGTTTVECSVTDAFGNSASGSFTVAVRPPVVVTLAIAGGTVAPATGVATIRGTVECTRGGEPAPPGTAAWILGNVTQRVGRTLVKAGFSVQQVACSASPAAWSGTTTPESSTGLLVAGSADVTVHAYPNVPGQGTSVTATVRLQAQR
jgi:hypothetical protein